MEKQKELPKVIAIVGPTASGKTALGIELARLFHGEIISADSRGLYRGMEIVAGVPSSRERRGVPHHLFSVADPKRQYSAGRFHQEGKKLINAMIKRGHLPIVVGGTGFYTEALLSGVSLPEVPPNAKLRVQLAKKTAAQLFAQLKKLDPRRAKDIDPNNKVRLIRAIEIAKSLGKVPAVQTPTPEFDVLWLGISPAEKVHSEAIRKRILVRLKKGMLKETEMLRKRTPEKRLRALGAEFGILLDYGKGAISKAELVERLLRWELLYAKRQMRFMRRNQQITWIKNPIQAKTLAKKFLR